MANLKPISKKQFLVTVEGLQATFTKCSAPKKTRAESEYNDGSTGQTKRHLDFITNDKVTISTNYDPVSHQAIYQWAEQRFKDAQRFSMTIQPVNPDLENSPYPGSKALVLTECQVVSVTYPDTDREGSGMATLAIELDPESFTFQ